MILYPYDVSCLRSFFVLVQFVFYGLAFVQGLKSIRLDYGEMDKDIGRNFWIHDEPKAFFLVKPLDSAFSHTIAGTSQPPGYPCQNNRHLVRLSARLEKGAIIENLRQKRQEECKAIVSSGIRLA